MECLECKTEMECVGKLDNISSRVDWLKCPHCNATAEIIYNGGNGEYREKIIHATWTVATGPSPEVEEVIDYVLKSHAGIPFKDCTGMYVCSQYLCLNNTGMPEGLIINPLKGHCKLDNPGIIKYDHLECKDVWGCNEEIYPGDIKGSELQKETKDYINTYPK